MTGSRVDSFSIPAAREIVKDYFSPNPAIYWADMLLCAVIGYGAASVYLAAPLFSARQVICYFIAGFT